MNYNKETTQNITPQGTIAPSNPILSMNQNPGNLNTTIPDRIPRKNILPIIIVVFIFVISACGFIAYKTIMSSPEKIFQTTIKNLYKGVNNSLNNVNRLAENFDVENKALTFAYDAQIESNISEVENIGFNLSDMKIGAGIGLDANNREATMNMFIKGPKEQVDLNGYYTKEKLYAKTNLLDKLIYVEGEDINIDFEQINNMIDELKKNMPETEDIDYLAKAIIDALAVSLDKSYMDKLEEKVKIGGNEQNLTKYSYQMSDKAIRSLLEKTLDTLSKDEKFIEILSNISEQSESRIEELIDDYKDNIETIEFEYKVVINIYTKGFFNKFAGLSIEVDNEEVISYIDDGTEFKMIIIENNSQIDINGSRQDQETIIKVIINNKKISTITIKALSKEKIDISLKLNIADYELGSSIYLTCNEEKTKIDGEYKVKIDVNNYYISLAGNYQFTSLDSLEIPTLKGAININDVNKDEVINNLKAKTSKDDVLNTIFEQTITEYESSKIDYDYNNMQVIASTLDIEKILNKKGPNVIYIGEDTYATDTSQFALLEAIKELQNSKNFHCYHLNSLNYNDEIKQILGNKTPVCTEAICVDTPVIYLIKDGTVISSISSPTSKEYLTSALQSIGIE